MNRGINFGETGRAKHNRQDYAEDLRRMCYIVYAGVYGKAHNWG